MSNFSRLQWWHQVVLIWLFAILLLNISGLVGSRMLELGGGFPTEKQSVSPYSIPGIWVRWDAGNYLAIAAEGYVENPEAAGFFPLYPMLISLVVNITGMNIVVVGFIISNLAFLFALLLLYKIARIINDDHVFAMRSVLAMMVFPTSFFYFAVYAESLYLALALLGVYLVMKNRQSLAGAGLALGLASVARPVGWLLDIVMLIEFLRRRKFDQKSFVSLVVGGLLSIAGILLYIYYLYIVLGTFMAIPNAQSGWHRQWQIPFITYWEGVKTLLKISLLSDNWFLYSINILDIIFTSFAVYIIVIAFIRANRKEFPYSLAIYSSFALLFFLSSQNELPAPLWGMSRWVASLFPIYFLLGNLFRSKKLQVAYFVGSSILLLLFTAWWASARWIS